MKSVPFQKTLKIFLVIAILFFLGGLSIYTLGQEEKPPTIFDIKILEITTSSAVISWKTDKKTDSIINYGLDRNYGMIRDPTINTEHQIVLDNILPNTDYYFQISAVDEKGNQATSRGFTFSTKKLVEVKGAERFGEEARLIEKAVEAVSQMKKEEAIAFTKEKIEEIGAQKAEELVIIGDPRVEVGEDWAKISWATNKEANSIVALVPESEYDPKSSDPYKMKIGEPTEYVLNHVVEIKGLKPATTYHFQVQSTPKIGETAKSEDKTFITLSILPVISNLQVVKVEEDAATLSWLTNIPCSSIIEYKNLKTGETKQVGDPAFVTTHRFRISNLDFDTTYQVTVRAENEQGDKTKSQPITFTTIKDEQPPTISSVTVDSTLYPGEEQVRVQVVVNWKTDENAICQFFYQEGLAEGQEGTALTPETEYSQKHIQVITEFAPNSTYKFWMKCRDKSGNEKKSEYYTLLTPTKEKSILDIIIENLQATFGWVKKIGR
jgi:chitodextrinase